MARRPAEYLNGQGGAQAHVATSGGATDYPQWEVVGKDLSVPVRGLASGLHTLVVRSRGIGTSLPRINEQSITFVVK